MSTEIPKTGRPAEEAEFSLEDLDKIIGEEDPNFLTEMADLSTISTDQTAIIESLDPDAVNDVADAEEQRTITEPLTRLDRLRHFVWDKQHKLERLFKEKKALFLLKRQIVLNKIDKIRDSLKTFALYELPDRLRYYKKRISDFITRINNFFKQQLSAFRALSYLQQTALFFTLFASIFSILLLSRVFFGGWLPIWIKPQVYALNDHAEFLGSYKDKNELVDLFKAFPEAEYYVLLKKVVVNLKPDKNSTANPMGLYELYLGLDRQDTAIEVKDREREILDIVQRTIEAFTYTDASSLAGKTLMKSAIKDELNKILNQGQVYRVYFNNFVTKM